MWQKPNVLRYYKFQHTELSFCLCSLPFISSSLMNHLPQTCGSLQYTPFFSVLLLHPFHSIILLLSLLVQPVWAADSSKYSRSHATARRRSTGKPGVKARSQREQRNKENHHWNILKTRYIYLRGKTEYISNYTYFSWPIDRGCASLFFSIVTNTDQA